MIAAGPPGGHFADATATLLPDGRYEIAVGTAEFGNGSTTVHAQIAADALGTTAGPDRDPAVRHRRGRPRHRRVRLHRRGGRRPGRAGTRPRPAEAADPGRRAPAATVGCRSDAVAATAAGPLKELRQRAGRAPDRPRGTGAAPRARWRSTPSGSGWRSTRTPASCGSCAACTAPTRARVMNPLQCRGQVEGGVAQALGATLAEHVDIDAGRRGDHGRLPAVPPADLRRRAAHRGALRRRPTTRSGRWARSR